MWMMQEYRMCILFIVLIKGRNQLESVWIYVIMIAP